MEGQPSSWCPYLNSFYLTSKEKTPPKPLLLAILDRTKGKKENHLDFSLPRHYTHSPSFS